MIKHRVDIRVRYGETDQMGYVHHSNYALYLEEARMDLFRSIGFDCKRLEREGVIMPVVSLETRFSIPLRFGDDFTVEVSTQAPWNPYMTFSYRLYRDGKQVARAKTTLVLADKATGRLITDPEEYLEPYYQQLVS